MDLCPQVNQLLEILEEQILLLMSEPKKSILPGIEIMIIIVFFVSFLLVAIPKCNKKQLEYLTNTETAEGTEPTSEPTTITTDTVAASTTAPVATATTTTAATPAPATTSSTIAKAPTIEQQATRLYVTLENLNMRTGPSLDSSIVTKLPLFEEVFFLNEITPFTQKISLGPEIADEPWVRIQTKSGKRGWVYGAGVYYYKRKRLQEEVAGEEE